jgi:hypothetical protein
VSLFHGSLDAIVARRTLCRSSDSAGPRVDPHLGCCSAPQILHAVRADVRRGAAGAGSSSTAGRRGPGSAGRRRWRGNLALRHLFLATARSRKLGTHP